MSTVPVILGTKLAGKAVPEAFGLSALITYFGAVRNEYAALFSIKVA